MDPYRGERFYTEDGDPVIFRGALSQCAPSRNGWIGKLPNGHMVEVPGTFPHAPYVHIRTSEEETSGLYRVMPKVRGPVVDLDRSEYSERGAGVAIGSRRGS